MNAVILFSVFWGFLTAPLLATPLENPDVIVVRSIPPELKDKNPNSYKIDAVKVADSSDLVARNVFEYVSKDPKYQKVLSAFKESQKAGNQKPRPLIIDITSTGYYGGCNTGPFKLIRENSDGTRSEENFEGFPRSQINKSVLRDGIPEGYSKEILFHETGHGVLWNSYSQKWPEMGGFFQVHSKDMVSEEGFAFNEGWAEAFDAYFQGKNSILENIESSFYKIGKDKTQLNQTEGVIADFLFNLAKSKKIENAYSKMTNVLSKYKPNSIYEFTNGFLETYPENAPAMQEILEKSIKDPTGKVRNALLKVVSVVTASKAYEKTKEVAGKTREVFEEIGRTLSETDFYKATSSKTREVVGDTGDSLASFGKSITNTDAYKTVSSNSKNLALGAKKSLIKTKEAVSKKSTYRSFFQKAKNFLSKIFKGKPEQKPTSPKIPLPSPESGISQNKSDSF